MRTAITTLTIAALLVGTAYNVWARGWSNAPFDSTWPDKPRDETPPTPPPMVH